MPVEERRTHTALGNPIAGCVCQAVRAAGVKCTLAAATREGSDGVATVSIWTVPVNQSSGPAAVSSEFLVICISAPRRGARRIPHRATP
jgi:hypothetical protein